MSRVRTITAAAIAIAMTVAVASSQAKTDFSGRWTTDPDPAAAPAAGAGAGGQRGAGGGGGGRSGDLGSGWGPTIAIAQSGSSLTVEYAFFSRGDMQPPLKFTYALDGTETKNSVMMGRGVQGQVAKTAWEGEKLVITTVHTFPNPENGKPMSSDVKQVLTLESPTSLVVETTRAGILGAPASTTRTVYRKL